MTIHTLDVALSQVGVKEDTGKNDGVPAERYMHGDELAWCAGFLLWCNANSDDPQIARTVQEYFRVRRVAALLDLFRERGAWLPPTTEPKSNDLAFIDWRRDVGSPGLHVDIIDRVERTKLYCVGGNVSNAVSLTTWRRSDQRITGFGRISLLK